MTAEGKKTVVRFEIKSLDPDRPIIDVVPAAENLSAELEAILAERYPGVKVEIRRDEGIPGARELQELLLSIDWHLVKEAVETTAAGWATKEFLKLAKEKLRNVFTKQVADQGAPATSSITHSPGEQEKTALTSKKANKKKPSKKKTTKTRKRSAPPKKKSQSSGKKGRK